MVFSPWLKTHPRVLLAYRREPEFLSLGVLMAFHDLTPSLATTFSPSMPFFFLTKVYWADNC